MTDETAAPTPHPEDQPHSGQPICDTCGQRAVWSEIHGWLHAPADRPFGLPTATDPAKHEVTTTEWMATYEQPARPVSQGTEDSDYREQIARAVAQECWAAAKVSPLVEQLRQARAAYNRMAAHAVDRAAERDRYYLAWQSAARGRRQARIERDRQGDLTVARRVLDEVAKKAVWLESETQRLRADLEARTCERDEARQELAGEKHVRRLNEHGLLGQLAALRSTAVVLPEDWRDQLDWAYCGEHRLGLNPMDLIESWRAEHVREHDDEHVREHDDAAPTCDEVVEEWAFTWDGDDRSGPPVRPPTLAETRTGADWCPSCRVEVGTNRYRDDDGTERCGTCGSELAESAPLAEEWRAFHEAATGVDPGPETPAPLAEPVRERDVVDFLLARHEASPLARCTGISSDALAYYAAGGRAEPAFPNEYPHDGTDLAACEKTYQMAPVQLRERMLPILERFRAHVASPGTGTEAGE